MKSTFIVFALLTTISTYGQRSYGIKVYQNTDIFNVRYSGSSLAESSEVHQVNFSRLSIALSIMTKKKVSHEVELFVPEISKSPAKLLFPKNYQFSNDPEIIEKYSAYSVRYEFIRAISNPSKRFVASLAVGLNPFFISFERTPATPNRYPVKGKFYGTTVNVTPRLACRLSERFSLDLNVPLKIYTLENVSQEVKNPQIPISQQKNGGTLDSFFEKAFTVRIGVMYRF